MNIVFNKSRAWRKQLFIIAFLLITNHAWLNGQGVYSISSSDLLNGAYTLGPAKDTANIHLLLRKGNLVYKTQPDSAIALYQQAYWLSVMTSYTAGRAMSYNNLASAYKEKNDYKKSLLYLRKSMQIPYKKTNSRLIEQHIDLFDLYYNLGDFQSVKKDYTKLIASLHPQKGDTLLLCRAQKYIAIAHFRSGNYDSSIYYYYRIINSLKTPDEYNFTTFVEIYNGLGAIWSRTDEHSKALVYFNQALKLAKKFKDTNQICMSLCNKTAAYIGIKDYKKAKKEGLEALALARKMRYYSYQSLIACDMASILNEEGRYNEALLYCEEARSSVAKVTQYSNKITVSYTNGYTYAQLKKYDKAEPYLQHAVQLAMEKGGIENISDAYLQLAEVYKHTGRYLKAYENMERYSLMRDSLRGKESAERIAHVEMRYQTEKKDKQLAQQRLLLAQKESKLRSKNVLIGGVTVSGLLLILLGLGRYRNRQRLQEEKLRNLSQKQEIERLHSRMEGEEQERGRIARELHDGVSVLLSAAKMNYMAIGKEYEELALTDTYKEVMNLLQETGQEVRSITYNLVPEMLIQQSLPAAVQAFCELIQKGHELEIKIQSYGNYTAISPQFAYSIYRIIQELIHNIIKHAHASQVLLQLMLHDNSLHVTIEDNGIGFEKPKSPGAGMGLQNLKVRIEQLKGHFSFTSNYEGTYVEIEIPEVSLH